MVCANYCASYPKQPCVVHKANMWYPCCMTVRRSSHRGGSLQNVLGDERTCGTTLASAYVLRHLSAAWLQLQMKEGSLSGSEC